METILNNIQQAFGIEELPRNLFYSLDQALRFELGGKEFGTDRPMRRFAQAYQRSQTVSEAFFKNSAGVFLFLSSYGEEQPDRKSLKPLKFCGLKPKDFQYFSKTPQQDDEHIAEYGSDIFRNFYFTKLKDKATIPEILWLGIASEMGIRPRFQGSTTAYLVDPEKGLILHLYDDRGMDLVAVEKAALGAIFVEFRKWLLDSDLDRMTDMFGRST